MPYRLDLSEQLRTEQLRSARFLARWAAILIPVSVAIGATSAFFLWSLDEVTTTRLDHPWLLYLLPIAGLALAGVYQCWGRETEGGNNLLLDEIHEPAKGVPARIAPLILAGTLATHLFGGSAGREGTALQMGGGIASGFNRFLGLEGEDRRILLIGGIAAGFGSIFGTPIAGAIFAMEVLTVGRIEHRALIPVLIASLTADYAAGVFGAHHTAYSIAHVARDGALPFDLALMAKVLLAGAAFGLVALVFSELTHFMSTALRSVIRSPLLRPVVGGVAVIALAAFVGRDYLGLGILPESPGSVTIPAAFYEGGADPLSWWWKLLFTAVSLSAGFKGGEVTPLFFIGATLGNRIAILLGAPVDLFAGLGFVAVFAAAANTPLTCVVMGIELFGAGSAVYIAAACFVAYVISGRSGIYLSQRVPHPAHALDPAENAPLRTLRESRPPFPFRRK